MAVSKEIGDLNLIIEPLLHHISKIALASLFLENHSRLVDGTRVVLEVIAILRVMEESSSFP
jgi:hypothetical protein